MNIAIVGTSYINLIPYTIKIKKNICDLAESEYIVVVTIMRWQ